ncbi:helix-turn-helix domain-containing protein [Micromonospora sp. M12]
MQITTLGPFAVDGQPVRGERLAAVIRTLVDARGRAVSTSLLVDAVWDGTPPDDATGAVQALVSRVRRLGLSVVAVPGGYRLPAEQVTVDAVEARTLVDQARTVLQTGDARAAVARPTGRVPCSPRCRSWPPPRTPACSRTSPRCARRRHSPVPARSTRWT